MRSVQRLEDDDAFCRLIYRFTINKMMRNINQGENTNNNDMMKQAKGEELWVANLNQIFYVRSMST